MLKKEKIDYKLVNMALIALIVCLIYWTGNLWIDAVNKMIAIVTPFVIAFALAYATQPIVLKMQEKGMPKGLAIGLLLFIELAFIIFVGYMITNVLVGQLSGLFSGISEFLNELSLKDWDINLSELQGTLNDQFQKIMTDITKYVSNGAINLIGSSINFLGKVFFGMAAYVYFLIDMDKIRREVRNFFKKKQEKTYNYVKSLDIGMKNYLSGLVEVMIISVFEYGIAYSIIGHPNAMLLGFLAGVANMIPYFGGIACNCIAAITAFVVSPGLFVRTLITFFLLSSLDSYVINPTVYGKTNSIHPLLTIFVMSAGSMIFGIMGIFISFPVAIILVTTYKYYWNSISDSIKEIKETSKQEKNA